LHALTERGRQSLRPRKRRPPHRGLRPHDHGRLRLPQVAFELWAPRLVGADRRVRPPRMPRTTKAAIAQRAPGPPLRIARIAFTAFRPRFRLTHRTQVRTTRAHPGLHHGRSADRTRLPSAPVHLGEAVDLVRLVVDDLGPTLLDSPFKRPDDRVPETDR